MRLTRYFLPSIAMIFFLYSFSVAQWIPEGLPFYFNYNLSSSSICPDGKSGVIIAWDHHDGQDEDIKAQRIDSAGYRKWGDDGIIIYEDDRFNIYNIDIISDGNGGGFISWEDHRNTDLYGTDIYVQHVNQYGDLKWDDFGARVFNRNTPQLDQDVVLDGEGGIIVVCHDAINGNQIIAQRINSDGQRAWGDSGIYIFNQQSVWRAYPRVYQSGNDFICVWNPRQYPYQNEYKRDIYAQKFDIDGNILWQDNGVPVVEFIQQQSKFSAIPDNHGGIVVAWIDDRHYPPTDNSVYIERLDSMGNSAWQENGMLVELGGSGDSRPDSVQIFLYDNNIILFWWPIVNLGLYAQYISIDGTTIWPSNRLFNTISFPVKFVTSGGNDFEYIGGVENAAFIGVKTDISGSDLWLNRPFLDTYIWHNLLNVISDDVGGLIACWRVRLQYYLRVQRIYSDGYVGGYTSVIDTEKKRANKIELFQNYPNPFNSSTNILYQLSETSDASIAVYNILGQLIYFSNFSNPMPGIYNLNLNMDNYPSGVYFVKLTSSKGFSDRLKINLLK